MTRAIIVHGMPDENEYFGGEFPSSSNSHWIPWLQKQLIRRGHDVQTPEMFEAYAPDYSHWSAEFERLVTDQPTILVGHSCGAGFLVRWLSEHPAALVASLTLVAPWMDPKRESTTDFFEFEIDRTLVDRAGGLHIFRSADDFDSIQETVAILQAALPDLEMHEFDNMGHFTTTSMGTDEFPELLAVMN